MVSVDMHKMFFYKLKYYLLLIILCSSFHLNANGPDNIITKEQYYTGTVEVNSFEESKWKEIVKDIDYSQRAVVDNDFDNANANNSPNNTGGGSNVGGGSSNNRTWGTGGFSAFFKILLILLVIALLGVVVFKMSGGNAEIVKVRKEEEAISKDGTINLQHVEQNIHKSDMELLIDKSLSQKDYMLSIRLYYLWVIKELSNNKMIKWKRDKTNRDYLREMSDNPNKINFKRLTRIFERVWYGNQTQLSKDDFLHLQSGFTDFIKSIKK